MVVDEAIELIIASKNPIILFGNGTIRKRASHRLRTLIKNLGVGVINTFMGKGFQYHLMMNTVCLLLV